MLTVIKNARLVDSEIDRQGSLLLQDERIIATGSIDAFSALEAEAAVIAVSYTHLTLPTN